MNYAELLQCYANSLCCEFEAATIYVGLTPAFPCCFVSDDNAVRFNTREELQAWYDENLMDDNYFCFEIKTTF